MAASKDFSAYSGERISSFAEDKIVSDHLARYRYAAADLQRRFADADSIAGADVFCGSGYGANILARVANATVLAIDGSDEMIAAAAEAYPRPNLLFAHKLFPFVLPRRVFDFVCSFESLEHVLDYQAFAAVLVDSLKPGGLLYVSCPNVEHYDLEANPYHWHFRHLTPVEMEDTFVGRGMTIVRRGSTQCNLHDANGSIRHYFFPIKPAAILDDLSGDFMFYVFQKGQP